MMKLSQFALRLPSMKKLLLLVVLFPACRPLALAQALPAAEAAPISTGFALPTVLGSLQYAVSVSQGLSWGYYGNGNGSAFTSVSGDVGYLSSSKLHPFSMILSAGQSFSESGQPSYPFFNLAFSQVANAGRWNMVLSDSISYLPGTAAVGLSGVPGIGDLGVAPLPVGTDSGQGVLSNYSRRISNSAAASLSRELTGKTSVSAYGSYGILRFVGASSGGAGLDSDSASVGGGLTHQINGRSSVGGNYSYSTFSYSADSKGVAIPGFSSQTATGDYSRQLSRRLSLTVAAGPQWTSNKAYSSTVGISLFASASGAYAGKFTSGSVAFTRATNSGFGTFGGALSNTVSASASRRFAMVWNCSANVSYANSSGLPVPGAPAYSSNTYVAGAQVSRAIIRNLSAFASYTLENQSYSAASAVDVFSGTSQVVSFGITYSRNLHLGH